LRGSGEDERLVRECVGDGGDGSGRNDCIALDQGVENHGHRIEAIAILIATAQRLIPVLDQILQDRDHAVVGPAEYFPRAQRDQARLTVAKQRLNGDGRPGGSLTEGGCEHEHGEEREGEP